LSFSSWIYRITHNITIDYYRKNKDKNSISLETEDDDYVNLIELIEAPINIEKEYQKKELIKKIIIIEKYWIYLIFYYYLLPIIIKRIN
jgi:DNA-directed RNA polymerase specialized sigma24 family protein